MIGKTSLGPKGVEAKTTVFFLYEKKIDAGDVYF